MGKGGRFKLPTLTELHEYLFGSGFGEAHNATADVEATTRCFLELIRLGYFPQSDLNQGEGYLSKFKEENPEPFDFIGLKHLNLKEESKKYASLLGYNYQSSEWYEQSYKIFNRDYQTSYQIKKDKNSVFSKFKRLFK